MIAVMLNRGLMRYDRRNARSLAKKVAYLPKNRRRNEQWPSCAKRHSFSQVCR